MTTPIVKTAIDSDKVGVIDSLMKVLVSDPAMRWVWPDPQKYFTNISGFAKASGGK